MKYEKRAENCEKKKSSVISSLFSSSMWGFGKKNSSILTKYRSHLFTGVRDTVTNRRSRRNLKFSSLL